MNNDLSKVFARVPIAVAAEDGQWAVSVYFAGGYVRFTAEILEKLMI